MGRGRGRLACGGALPSSFSAPFQCFIKAPINAFEKQPFPLGAPFPKQFSSDHLSGIDLV